MKLKNFTILQSLWCEEEREQQIGEERQWEQRQKEVKIHRGQPKTSRVKGGPQQWKDRRIKKGRRIISLQLIYRN